LSATRGPHFVLLCAQPVPDSPPKEESKSGDVLARRRWLIRRLKYWIGFSVLITLMAGVAIVAVGRYLARMQPCKQECANTSNQSVCEAACSGTQEFMRIGAIAGVIVPASLLVVCVWCCVCGEVIHLPRAEGSSYSRLRPGQEPPSASDEDGAAARVAAAAASAAHAEAIELAEVLSVSELEAQRQQQPPVVSVGQ
jgi:hypothetical protein